MSSTVATSVRQVTPSIFTRTFMLGIVGSLSMYLASWENADRVRDNYLDRDNVVDTYDFIIVGGGTSGSILGKRLSEKYKTLVLEAGGEPHPFQAVPLLSNYLLRYAELDWKHVSMPQTQAFRGSVQSRASISQGRGLGGTTNIDYMMYLRGSPKDFDNWAEITEDKSWSYSSVLQYFKSLEKYQGPWTKENHGQAGELIVKQPAYTGLADKFCQAAQQVGYIQTDLNSNFTEGCDVLTYPTKKGYRDSVYNSFLKKAKGRRNLVIQKYAHVNKVLIRGSDNMVYGVEYDRHGKTKVAYAKKEIIIAAGAIQTAKILMLSGIGPKADLDSIGIPVKADLPVGNTLQDHLSVYLGPFFVDREKSLNIDRDVGAASVLSLARNNGPLTTTGFHAAAMISSGLEKLHGGRNWPDLQLTLYGISHHKSSPEDFSHAYQLRKDVLEQYLEHSIGRDSFSIVVSGGRPKSSGTVKLLNRNPYAPLIINPNYFDKIYDVVVMVDGVKKALRFVENSTAFYDVHAQYTRETLPGCERYRFRSDAYWECYVRTMSVSLGNVAGTAPMGSKGVLDSKMRVKGILGLRVIDASVMPSIVSTSTGGAVMMIAEKGAALILSEWAGTKSEVASTPKESSNTVFDKIKDSASKMKLGLDSSKALLDTLKFAAESNTQPVVQPFNVDDLQKLTKSMGDLAALLGPADNLYSGSFDIGNDTTTESALASMMTLAPMLKSQFGGLYQNLFADTDTDAVLESLADIIPSKSEKDTKVVKSSNTTADIISPKDTLEALKLIQGLIKNDTAVTSVKVSTSVKEDVNDTKNMSLEDVFGMTEGLQEELEEYEVEEPVPVPVAPPKKIVTTTNAPKTTTSNLIDLPYEVLSLVKSKAVLPASTYINTVAKPVYPKVTSNNFVLPQKSVSITTKAPKMTPDLQKFKNLEALAQIQHETIAKIKQKQQQQSYKIPSQNRRPESNQFQSLQQSAPNVPFGFPSFPSLGQQFNTAQSQRLPIPPQQQQYLGQQQQPYPNIPVQGAFPQQYYQGQANPLSSYNPNFNQLQQRYPQKPNPYFPYQTPAVPRPGLFGTYPTTQNPVDPTDLRYAVSSIMDAKYTYPTSNPFTGILSFLGQSSKKEYDSENENSVLKALQLRSNVDHYLNFPLFKSRPSPIPITYRPTPPPPPTYPAPSPSPISSEPDSIFAPIKDALSPLTSLMKSPFSLIPNPFATTTTTTEKPFSFFPSLFSKRMGTGGIRLMEFPQSPLLQPIQPNSNRRNNLADVLPRFFVSQTKPNGEISPEMFLLALANLTNDIPKPFVLEPSNTKAFKQDTQSQRYSSGRAEGSKNNKKQLDQSISDILRHLKNHHIASIAADAKDSVKSSTEANTSGINSANEILNIEYTQSIGSTTKASVPATPKVKTNPPIEFHKSPWANDPLSPTKSLHFKIKILKD